MCTSTHIKLNESAVILIVKLIILIEMSKSMLWIKPSDIYCTQNGFSYAMIHIKYHWNWIVIWHTRHKSDPLDTYCTAEWYPLFLILSCLCGSHSRHNILFDISDPVDTLCYLTSWFSIMIIIWPWLADIVLYRPAGVQGSANRFRRNINKTSLYGKTIK